MGLTKPKTVKITFCVRGVISPILSNLYLNEVDRMLEKAIATTRCGQYTAVQYARFADDVVVLIDSHPRHDWLVRAVEKRIREEIAKLRVEINEEKSRIVDGGKGGSFTFLGFEYRRILGRNRKWRSHYAPKRKKRTALLAKLREIFRHSVSQPVGGVIAQINPILRGWVNYFAIGDSSECFSFVRDWVEKKIRRHLMRARSGFGWRRWSTKWLYAKLGLYHDYRLRRPWSSRKAQFEILTMLLERPGEVFTRDEIGERLWPDGTFVDFDHNISSAIRKRATGSATRLPLHAMWKP
jgi:RNA-directed DNA polymerase